MCCSAIASFVVFVAGVASLLGAWKTANKYNHNRWHVTTVFYVVLVPLCDALLWASFSFAGEPVDNCNVKFESRWHNAPVLLYLGVQLLQSRSKGQVVYSTMEMMLWHASYTFCTWKSGTVHEAHDYFCSRRSSQQFLLFSYGMQMWTLLWDKFLKMGRANGMRLTRMLGFTVFTCLGGFLAKSRSCYWYLLCTSAPALVLALNMLYPLESAKERKAFEKLTKNMTPEDYFKQWQKTTDELKDD